MTYVGQPLDRRDGRLKVTGQALYAAEFPVPDHAHAVLVRSTVASGTVTAIDTADAAKMDGVIRIITPDTATRLNTAKAPTQGVLVPLLQDNRVFFNGQTVAVVVGQTLDQARAAASHVTVRYAQGEANVVLASALSSAYPPKQFRGGAEPPDKSRGDLDAGWAAGAARVEARYSTPVEHHNPMEPHATIAAWDGDRLTVWTATQSISSVQQTLAHAFDLPRDHVRVICPFVGGGFGTKGSVWPPVTLAAMAARLIGRPVSLVLTRADMYTNNGYRPATIQTLRLAAARDGTLTALSHEGVSSMSSADLGEYSEGVALASQMLYACPNGHFTHRIADLTLPLPTFMRAPGEAPGVFALECAMDELAVALAMDPVALRLKNYADSDPGTGKPFSSKRLRDCYARGAEAFGWGRRDPTPRSMRQGRMLVGYGMATATYPGNRRMAEAAVTFLPDGTAVASSGTQDLGTGTWTVMAQVAADALDMPYERVRFELGDSTLPPAPGSGGSQTVASVTPAVMAACAEARRQVLALAAQDPRFAGRAPRFTGGVISADGQAVTLADLLAGKPPIVARATAAPGAERRDYSFHSFGAHFTEVHVDPDTGEIRVARHVGAFDAGRIVNARTARSQMLGGIVFGIGMALLERTEIDGDTGRVVNANVSEYVMPVNADIPDIQVITIGDVDPHIDPLGARGIGELPTVGTAAAVANAVYHATGKRVRDLPIRIEDVLA